MKRALLVVAMSFTLAACGKRATREWQASDHDEEPGTSTQAQAPAQKGAGAGGAADLVDATWTGACAVCHGASGRGDGPNGPMVGAPDLGASALQDARTDQQLADAIKNGKGKMPKFAQLPDSVVAGLIKKIRSLRH